MQASQPLPLEQVTQASPAPQRARSPLSRAISFLGLHRRAIAVAYGALFVATLAQLAVPELVQNMINAVTQLSAPTSCSLFNRRWRAKLPCARLVRR